MSDDQPWTLARIYADLTCLREVARELNVDQHRVYRWVERRARTGAPLPVRVLSGGMNIYSMEEWKGWYARWAKTRGTERFGPVKPFSQTIVRGRKPEVD